MKIIQAAYDQFPDVKQITQTTIRSIYPGYYPEGAVQFFCTHHSDEKIQADITSGSVFLLSDNERFVGTVTICGNEICRLFVLPQHQHKGYGRALLDFAEHEILARHDTIVLDASLPAKQIYRKRGYRETDYHIIQAENGDYLCYDVMELHK